MARRNFLSGGADVPKPSVLKPVSAVSAVPNHIGSNGSISPSAEAPRNAPNSGPAAEAPPAERAAREPKLQVVESTLMPAAPAQLESAPAEPRAKSPGQGRATKSRKEKYPLHWQPEVLETLRDASVFTRRPMNTLAIEFIRKGLQELAREANGGEPFPPRDQDPQVGRRCSS